jgi:hypothetical protein
VVKDFTYDAQAGRQSDKVYWLYFDKGPERVAVGWTTGPPLEERVSSGAPMTGLARVIDTAEPGKGNVSGQAWQCQNQHCSVTVTLTDFPKIISLTPEQTVAKP